MRPGATVVSETAKTLGINEAGARLHALQSQAAPLFAAGGPPPMDRLTAIATSAGVTLLGPPLRSS